MKTIDDIVKEIISVHPEGKEFFDNLDQAVQHPDIFGQIIELFIKVSHGKFPSIIVSGKFGSFFINCVHRYMLLSLGGVYYVNGGLREGTPIDSLDYIEYAIKDREFIFIDDSFYSGKTRDAIQAEIERLGGELVKTIVVYDGSISKDSTVESLYRYHKGSSRVLTKEESEKYEKSLLKLFKPTGRKLNI